MVLSILPHGPDVNPIIKFFHLVSMKLKNETVERSLENETFQECSIRVKNNILEYLIVNINKIIASIDKTLYSLRVAMMLSRSGNWIKY